MYKKEGFSNDWDDTFVPNLLRLDLDYAVLM